MVVWYGLVKGLVVRYGIVIGWLLVWFSEEMVGMVWGGGCEVWFGQGVVVRFGLVKLWL